jgi:hypothetical protein
LHTAEDARARGLTRPSWLKNDGLTVSYMYQIGLPDDPDERRVNQDERW